MKFDNKWLLVGIAIIAVYFLFIKGQTPNENVAIGEDMAIGVSTKVMSLSTTYYDKQTCPLTSTIPIHFLDEKLPWSAKMRATVNGRTELLNNGDVRFAKIYSTVTVIENYGSSPTKTIKFTVPCTDDIYIEYLSENYDELYFLKSNLTMPPINTTTSCLNNCSYMGQRTCYGGAYPNIVKICQFQETGCLDWSLSVCSLGQTCTNGYCVGNTTG